MSRIDELISEQCSNGVPYASLGDCLIRTKGTKITADQMQQLHKENAPVKIFAGGKTVAYFDYNDLPEKDIQTNPSIIVKSRGLVEFEYYDGPFSHKNEFWAYHSKNNSINIKYVYYYLKNQESYFRSIATSMGSLPQIAIPITDNFRIPIPPIAIQEEIVRILDNFTDLSAELSAELSARKKQYEYYRDKLLVDNPNSTSVKVKDVTKDRFWIMPATPNFISEKGVPYITSKNIRKGKILFENVKNISEEDYRAISNNRPIIENDILISMIGTLGEIAIVQKSDLYFYGQNMFLLRLNENIINIRYFYHFFDTKIMKEYFNSIKNASSQGYLRAQHIEEVNIPLPSLEEQERIVAILDRFDTLCNDLTIGLPAEIDARRKQYEYYRDKLLTFQEA